MTGDKKVWSLIKIWISVIKKNKNKKLAKKTFFVRKQRHSLRQAHSFWYVSIKSKSIKRILVKFHTIVSWYGAGFFLTNCNNVNEFFLIKIKAWRHFSCIARYLIYLMAFVFFVPLLFRVQRVTNALLISNSSCIESYWLFLLKIHKWQLFMASCGLISYYTL